MLWHNTPLPQSLSVIAELHRKKFIRALAQAQLPNISTLLAAAKQNKYLPDGAIPSHTEFLQQLNYVFSCSEFVAFQCCKNPKILAGLISSGELFTFLEEDFFNVLKKSNGNTATSKELDAFLRITRNKVMVRIIWRDFTRMATLENTIEELSHFADAAIQTALNWHYAKLVAVWGEPIGAETGRVQTLLVVAMGKLGAAELNVSSDIDLIFAFPEAGVTSNSNKQLNNQEFFIRLGQALIKSLDASTADGFVFRVDMRLRPQGQSGELVHNFKALENYYQSQGRDWERFAMIKARTIVQFDNANCTIAAQQLMLLLRSFTYRQYIDFSVIESLRSIKGLINRQVQRKGMDLDVKLGAGGIREIEFIVQMFQLIRGGCDVQLQIRKVCRLLPLLEKEKYLPSGVGEKLLAAYVFLRNTEHGIQGFQDRQTQTLPQSELDCTRLAWVMGCSSWKDFLVQLDTHRTFVGCEFQSVINVPTNAKNVDAQQLEPWQLLWDKLLIEDFPGVYAASKKEKIIGILMGLKQTREVRVMQEHSRERLDIFMPRLLLTLFQTLQDTAPEVLQRLVPFIEAVVRRSIYLVLLVENPVALGQLIKLCAASPWISNQLVHHPILLDELLTPEKLYAMPSLLELRDELRREVLRLPWHDLEGHMEALRHFRAAHALRAAASEVTCALSVMQVSDYLTYIAEAILEHVLALAWEQMVVRHGYPRLQDGQCERLPNFIIVAYGKLGGLELGHNSDLDLVFIHATDAMCNTDGAREIDNFTFYTRLGQRIIHILTTNTLSGPLYEVDMRLRPSGNSGMLVTSFSAYEKYQFNDAWVWEQQALVRARAVAGNGNLAQRFHRVRRRVLMQERELVKLRFEVVSMREKMRTHMTVFKNTSDFFDLKQGLGAIVDIEFVVQYAVLAWAHNIPELAQYTDNIHILEILGQAGCLNAGIAAQLIEAYKSYRAAGHQLVLQNQKGQAITSKQAYAKERACVTLAWQQLLLQ